MMSRCAAGRLIADRYAAGLALAVLFAAALGACERRPEVPPPAPPPEVAARPTPELRAFTATAYSIEGKTASGRRAREGIVAADPRILPLGSRIRISDAGRYSGVYTVADTGRAIKGHELDIYIASDAEAKRFGKRSVKVEVLQHGSGAARDGATAGDASTP